MAVDIKALTPAAAAAASVIMGAASTAAASPSLFTTSGAGSVLLTNSGDTITTNAPVLDLAQTWNAAGVTFTGLKFNFTDTASAAASLLLDLQVGGSSLFKVAKSGILTVGAGIIRDYGTGQIAIGGAAGNFYAASAYAQAMGSNGFAQGTSLGAADVYLRRAAAATWQCGAADAAAPVAQTFQVQSVVAGTSNTAGANWTINGSRGTGTGAGGSITFQVAPAGTTGTAQNALSAALTIRSDRTVVVGAAYTVATLPAAGNQGRRAWVTDATSPTFGGTLTGGGSVVIPVFDNGTAWVPA